MRRLIAIHRLPLYKAPPLHFPSLNTSPLLLCCRPGSTGHQHVVGISNHLPSIATLQRYITTGHTREYTPHHGYLRSSAGHDTSLSRSLTSPRISSTPLLPTLVPGVGIQPHRPITALALRGGASVVGGLLAFVLFQAIQRQNWNQKRRIRNVFRALPAPLLSFRPGPLFLPRDGKVAFTRENTDADPSGPIVITGPAGSGKTMILKKSLAARPHTLYVSLRATPVTSGDSLALSLVEQAGYLMPPTELLSRAIFNKDMSSTSSILAEIDRALKLINEVLEEEKARGWIVQRHGNSPLILPPLICIDELNLNEVGSGLLDDSNFWKLVDWAMHISDNRLGHVIFSCGLEVADMLDAYPGFRMRRTKLHFDFPRPSTVHSYLTNVVNPFLRDTLGATPKVSKDLKVEPKQDPVLGAPPTPSPPTSTTKSAAEHADTGLVGFLRNVFSAHGATEQTVTSPVQETIVDNAAAALLSGAGNPGELVKVVDAGAVTKQANSAVVTPTPHEEKASVPTTPTSAMAQKTPPPQTNDASTRRLMPWEFDARIESTDPDKDLRATSRTLHTLEPWEIDRIVEVVGGHLKDIDTVVSAIARGKHWAMPLERMIADSCDLVERTLDEILASASGNIPNAKPKQSSGGLSAQAMPRARAGARLGLAGYALPSMPVADFSINPSTERLAAYARYLRAWALLNALSQRKYIPKRDLVARYFAECPHELDFFIDAGLIMSVNVKTSTKMHVGVGAPTTGTSSHGVASPAPVFGMAGTTSLTLPGTYVSASSPRMRVAFRVLAADAKLRAQTQRVAASVALARLRQEEDRLLKRIQEVSTERTFAAQQMTFLMARDTALRGTVIKEMLSVSPLPTPTAGPPDAPQKGPLWSLALPLSEDFPPLGMQALAQAIRRAERAVRALDEDVGHIRDALAEVRTAMVAAQRKAEVPLPGTEDATSHFTLANDEIAAALGASLNKEAYKYVGSDTEGSDEEEWAFSLPSFRRKLSTRPASEASESPKSAEGPKSDAPSAPPTAAKPPSPPDAPNAPWNSLEVYRGNTARAIQMYSTTGGYVYRNGAWEYVYGDTRKPNADHSTTNVNPTESAAHDHETGGYNAYGGYRWWL